MILADRIDAYTIYIYLQERIALQRCYLEREHKLTCNVTTLTDQFQVTNQVLDECVGDGVMGCEWGECRFAVPSKRQLMTHITEHIQSGRCVVISAVIPTKILLPY